MERFKFKHVLFPAFGIMALVCLMAFSEKNNVLSENPSNGYLTKMEARGLSAIRTGVSPDTTRKGQEQWDILFDGKGNMDEKWRGTNSDSFPSDIWAVENDLLFIKDHKAGGDIMTREKYSDFILTFDFKLTYGANSGIKYFVNYVKNYHYNTMAWNGPEYQIIDDYNHEAIKGRLDDPSSTAALYLVYSPKNKKLKPAGEWNQGKIVAKGNQIEHWLNGVKVISAERGSKDYRDRISLTKFNHYQNYGEERSGHIMITDHDGDKVFYRNIKIMRTN